MKRKIRKIESIKKKRITVSSAKAKGRNLQNWAAKKISEITGIPYGREDHALIEPRQMGQSGVDVILRGEALKAFPFSIECKSTESWALPATIRQVKANQAKNTDWLIILKKKEFQKPIVVIDAEAFFLLYKKYLVMKNNLKIGENKNGND